MSILAIGNCNYCRTGITSFNKNVDYNTNGIETVKSFWKLVSKDSFPKLKDFALKLGRALGNTTYRKCVRVRTFSTMKQVKSAVKTETEWQTKHWTIVSDLLPRIRNDSVRETSTTGIPLIEICNQLLFAIV